MNEAQPAVPAITTLLLSKGKNTIGHETNLSRSPLWSARKQMAPDETVVSPMLYGHAFLQVEGSHSRLATSRSSLSSLRHLCGPVVLRTEEFHSASVTPLEPSVIRGQGVGSGSS